MSLTQEIKNYIDSLFENLQVKSLMNGTRMLGSETGENSFISGTNNAANAPHSVAMGSNNEVKLDANSAVALGDNTIAYSPYQLVHGKYNELDANNIHAHIIGGGTDENNRRNIYTLDWEGNATFAGKVSFAESTNPTSGNDLISLDYLNSQIAIKFFPHVLSEDGIKATIYVNDLEAFTAYKVKQEGQTQVQFMVRTESGRNVPFYVTDLSVNRYNMFVGTKTQESITFFLNSSIYTIDLKTGKLSIAQDQTITTPGTGEIPESNSAAIDDESVSVDTTWSSAKIEEMLQSINAVSNAINRVGTLGLQSQEEYMVFYTGEKSDVEVCRIELPYVAWKIKEQHVLDWNRVKLKITAPNGGELGQLLIYDGVNNNYTYSSGGHEIRTQWADLGGENGLIVPLLLKEEERKALKDIFDYEK